MYLAFTTNWGHKNNNYLQIRNSNNNNNNIYIYIYIYTIQYVAWINCIIKR